MKPKIIVCIKQVPDPEGPPSAFQIDQEEKRVNPVGISPVLNPFDENSLEAALKIKDFLGGKITAISMENKPAMSVLKKALSVGADELVIIKDDNFKDIDSHSTAKVLASAINKIGDYDLILAGRQTADWSFGITGATIAEILQIPLVSVAQKIEIENDNVIVEKLIRNGCEVVKTSMPALVTVSSEIGDLRLFSLQSLKEARNKPVTTYTLNDLAIDPKTLEYRIIEQISPPPPRERDCVFIEGESPDEKGEMLAVRLRQDHLI